MKIIMRKRNKIENEPLQATLPWGEETIETVTTVTRAPSPGPAPKVTKTVASAAANTVAKPVTKTVTKPEEDSEIQRITQRLYQMLPGPTAQKKLNEISRLRNEMRDGICHFKFIKANGERRDSYGTRNREIIETESKKKLKTEKKSNDSGYTFPYFDLQKKEWRCFNVERFESFDTEYAL